MALDVSLINTKTGNRAKVNGEGELNVVVHPHPPADEEINAIPFRQYFTINGLATNSFSMLVDGSSANESFYITASNSVDIYVKTVSAVIVDAGATLNKFGNITALTNGLSFEHITQDQGTIVIQDSIKTNFDFIRLSLGQPAFGDGANSFRGTNVSGNSEGYIPVINMTETFGLPWGLRLRKGTKDRLAFTVKDDVSALDQFDIIGYGIQL